MPEKFLAFVRIGEEFWALFDFGCNIVHYAADESEVKSRYLVFSRQEIEEWVKGWTRPSRFERQRKKREEIVAVLRSWPVPHPDPEFDPY